MAQRYVVLACLATILASLVAAMVGAAAGGPEVVVDSIEVLLRGLRWRGDPAMLHIAATIGEEVVSDEISVGRGAEVVKTFRFERVTVPAKFSVSVAVGESEVFALEGTIERTRVRITRAAHDEALLVPHGGSLLEVVFTGRFYTVELTLPVRGEVGVVECSVDGVPVRADVVVNEDGVVIAIKDAMLTGNSSTFTVLVSQSGKAVSFVRGMVTGEGLREIAIEGGLLERLNAKATVTTGSRKVIIPTSILGWGFVAEETLSVIRTTELVVTSTQIVIGNVEVRLRAFSRGSWLRNPSLIPGARFEVTIVGYNVTKVYENDEVAYLPAGEKVIVRAVAEGYLPKEEVLVVSNDTRELTFYLEEASPSPLRQLETAVISVLTHPLFVPILLGVIMALLLILLMRGS